MPRRKTSLNEGVDSKTKKVGLKVKVTKTKLSKLETSVKKIDPKSKKLSVRPIKLVEPVMPSATVQPAVAVSLSVESAKTVMPSPVVAAQPITAEPKGQIISQSIYDRDDRQKKVMLWTGVSFFMVLFISFWLFNLKTIFKVDNSAVKNNNNVGLEDITSNLSKTMDEVSKSLDKLNNVATTTATSTLASPMEAAIASTTASSTPVDVIIGSTSPAINPSQAELNVLKARLQLLEKQLGTTTGSKLPTN